MPPIPRRCLPPTTMRRDDRDRLAAEVGAPVALKSGGCGFGSRINIVFAQDEHNDLQRPPDRCAGLVTARSAFGAVGRIILFRRGIAARIAVTDDRVPARSTRRNHFVAGVMDLSDTRSDRLGGLAAIFCTRASQ